MQARVTKTSRLPQIRVQARAKAVLVVDRTAHDVEASSKRIILEKDIVDTGATLNSVHVESRGDLQRRVGPGTDYSEHLEFGTTRMAGRPFMIPAAEEHRTAFTVAMGQIVD